MCNSFFLLHFLVEPPSFLNEFGPPDIDPDEIKYDEQKDFLGKGSFGSVYKGFCRGQRVAIKVPNKQNLSQQEMEDFKNEVKLMK